MKYYIWSGSFSRVHGARRFTLEDSQYRIVFEIQNRNMNKTIQLKSKSELGFFTILNNGTTEELGHKFIKCHEL